VDLFGVVLHHPANNDVRPHLLIQFNCRRQQLVDSLLRIHPLETKAACRTPSDSTRSSIMDLCIARVHGNPNSHSHNSIGPLPFSGQQKSRTTDQAMTIQGLNRYAIPPVDHLYRPDIQNPCTLHYLPRNSGSTRRAIRQIGARFLSRRERFATAAMLLGAEPRRRRLYSTCDASLCTSRGR
jgi:hypothetical protein